MAINPNTDFTAGAVLTAAQQNRFGRGVMTYVQATANAGPITAETVTLTAPAFTSVANRYYKITYFEPACSTGVSGQSVTARVRLTNVTGTQQCEGLFQATAATAVSNSVTCLGVTTFTAGSVTLVATIASPNNTNLFRGAVNRAFLLVEDMGPA